MAKSKQQKQREAMERKQKAYFEHSLISLHKRMPGGDFFGTGKHQLVDLISTLAYVLRSAKEANVSFEGKPDSFDSSLEWGAEFQLVWLLARTNWFDCSMKMQENFNKYIGSGEIPFSLNMNRFDSDLEELRKAFEEL